MKVSLLMKAAVFLTIVFLVAAFIPFDVIKYASDDPLLNDADNRYSNSEYVDKEETIYAFLSADGSLSSLVAVSLLNIGSSTSSGSFSDKSQFENDSVTVLTPNVDFELKDGSIVFNTTKDTSSVYYRCTPVSDQLPFEFTISYMLDGIEVESSQLAGLSGDIDILIAVRSNPDAEQYFRENFICQIQVPLPVDIFSSVSAPGGQKILAGGTATYTFTVLPQSDKDIHISCKAELFELQSLTIACVPFDVSSILGEDVDIDPEQLNKLSAASSELADGAAELSDGLSELRSAIGIMNGSADALVEGNDQLLDAFGEYLGGMTGLTQALHEVSDGLTLTASQGLVLYQSFITLNSQLSALLDALIPLTAALPESEQLQLQGMANGIRSGLADFETALGQYTEAVDGIASGTEQVGSGMDLSLAGGNAIQNAIAETGEGLQEFAGGIGDIYSGSSALAGGAAQLADGQASFAAGLGDSIGSFDPFIKEAYEGDAVSFMNSNITVNSVQFIISTQAIKIAEPEPEPEQPEEEKTKTFWQKLLELFGIGGT